MRKGNQSKADVLHCIRDDGSETFSDLKEGMIHHELMHLAVEHILEYSDAFYGLIVKG